MQLSNGEISLEFVIGLNKDSNVNGFFRMLITNSKQSNDGSYHFLLFSSGFSYHCLKNTGALWLGGCKGAWSSSQDNPGCIDLQTGMQDVIAFPVASPWWSPFMLYPHATLLCQFLLFYCHFVIFIVFQSVLMNFCFMLGLACEESL